MKLFVNHFEKFIFESKLDHLKHVDFSLFVDYVPQSQNELSDINIISFQEPNEYFGIHDWVIENKNLFNIILTWDDKVINHCENAMFLPFGTTWLKPEQYEKKYPKYFRVSHVRGNLLKTYGHSLRFEYHDRSQKELKIPYKSWEVAGIREKIETCAIAKCELFGDAQFGVAIENTSHRGYFTEKIMELFLFRTIPVYWGCPNIHEFFDMNGVICFENEHDMLDKINTLTPEVYLSKMEAIETNYKLSLQYANIFQRMSDAIYEFCKINSI